MTYFLKIEDEFNRKWVNGLGLEIQTSALYIF